MVDRAHCTQGLAEDKVAQARAAEQAEYIPERNEDGKTLTKKEKAALQRAAVKQMEATAAAEANRMEPEVFTATKILSHCRSCTQPSVCLLDCSLEEACIQKTPFRAPAVNLLNAVSRLSRMAQNLWSKKEQ